MRLHTRIVTAFLLFPAMLAADTLGFVEQKFTDLHFEKGKWSKTPQLPCYSYVAREDGATVEVLRFGMGNLVPFTAKQGLTVTVCGSVASFDEGFRAGAPISAMAAPKTP
jgi:hypothetical protein